MIEEQALILALSKDTVLVEIKHQSSCGSCSAKSSCGTSSLSQLFGNRPSQFNLDIDQCTSSPELKVGDIIMIGLDDLSYLKASAFIYLLPLLFMFVFGVLAEQFLALADIFVLLFTFFGLWFGFQSAKRLANNQQTALTPHFIKKINRNLL